MDISNVAAPVVVPIKSSETGLDKPAETKGDDTGTRLPQPTVLAALPPGQGTRVDQLA